MTTAADLVEMLNRHYVPEGRPAAGLFASEVGSPDGRRRADALWMPFTRSGGTGLVGHEIKVSRSDVLVELHDPTKAEPWMQFCDAWWLVVSDRTLVEGLDIPETWGIMSPPSGRRKRSMTVVRSAPKLNPMDAAPGIRRLLSWYFHRAEEATGTARREADYARRQVEGLQLSLMEARAGQRGGDLSRRVARIIHEIETLSRGRDLWGGGDDSVIAQAVVDATAVRLATEDARRELKGLIDRLEQPFGFARDRIKRALEGGA